MIYENRMSSSFEVAVGPYGAITRDSSYEYDFFFSVYHLNGPNNNYYMWAKLSFGYSL